MPPFAEDDLSRHTRALRTLARDLLGDAALAEDAVQDAQLAALERPPARPVALGAWLRTVVRRCALDAWRSERRRRVREQRVARDEAFEPRDTAQLLEVQQHVLAAVRALDEPYRTAVWLRWFEDHSPAQIAQATATPVKTVKTRLWRALQLLRQRLDAGHGDRARWVTAVLPLACAAQPTAMTATDATVSSPITAAVAAGATLMHGKILLSGAALLLLASGGWWIARADPAPESPAAPVSPTSAVLAAVADEEVANASAPADARTTVEVVDAEPATPYGALVVRARWHDGTPAADVAIDLLVRGEPQVDRNEHRLITDENGGARADGVHEGPVTITSDRGGTTAFDVRRGAVHEVVFQLARGVDVLGIVVDEHGRPFAGAEVTLVSPRAGWLGGRVLATSGGDGAFALRSVEPTWSLGARAPGYAPSALVDLEELPRGGDAPLRVRLELARPGGAVAGKVVDDAGAGIAGAVVVLGRGPGGHFEATRWQERWSPHVAVTAADGTFRCDGVEPGEHPVAARAAECTRATGSVTCIASETASITLELSRGMTVRGTVRDATGEPVAKAIVTTLDAPEIDLTLQHATSERAEIKRPRVVTDAMGAFELRGVPAGAVHLLSAVQTDFGQFPALAQATLAGRAGDVVAWDPVLHRGKTLRVRLVNADGTPAHVGRGIHAIAEQPAGAASTMVAMARQRPGDRVEFVGCADVPYTVGTNVDDELGGRRWVFTTGVIPDGPEAELRLPRPESRGPAGAVRCRVLDPAARARGQVLAVSLSSRLTRRSAARDGDRYAFADVPPGRYFVWVQAGDAPLLVGEEFELRAAQELDLGDLAIAPPGTVRVTLRTAIGDVAKPSAVLGSPWGYDRVRLLWDGAHLTTDNATPGRTRVWPTMADWCGAPHEIDVVAGQETLVTLDVVPGCRRRFRIALPLPDRWQRCELAVRDAQGTVIATERLSPGNVGIAPGMWHVVLPLGALVLDADLDGRRHSWPIDCRDATTAATPLRFSLR
jgi:RNA polymerase sigma factor (sigma-70 family)